MTMVTLYENEKLGQSFAVREDLAEFFWSCGMCNKTGNKIESQGFGPSPVWWWAVIVDCPSCQGQGFVRRAEKNPDYVRPVEAVVTGP